MSEADLALYAKCTGRTDFGTGSYRESYVISGRRSGKSRLASLQAVYAACFIDYRDVLVSGERGVVMVLSTDRRQCQVILRYVLAFLESVPLLKQKIVSVLKESIVLNNGITIEIHTADYRSVRGFSCVCCVLDELAFWPCDTAASPDKEVIAALRPTLATIPTGLLLAISSPYSKRGSLWTEYKANFGQAGAQTLVWQSDSRTMNSTISSATITMAYARDPQSARSEFGGQFRDDVSSLFSVEGIERVMVKDRYELPPISGVSYTAFTDPSGGQSDSMTLGVSHYDAKCGVAILDCLRETSPPFSPESVVKEFVDVLKKYRIGEIHGDRYAASWCSEQFEKLGISYRPSERSKSEIYLDFVSQVNSAQCELLDQKKLLNQLVDLERRTARGGRDSIDHSPNGHDDTANSAAGSLTLALSGAGGELSLIAYEKAVAAGTIAEVSVLKPGNSALFREEKPPCPNCNGPIELVNRCGNQWHCNKCAADWPHARATPPYFGMNRGEYLRGRR